MARNYIILNGVNSNTITGLLISTLPPITKPKQRTQIEEIDGRDGDIVTKLGYSAYEKEFEIGLYGDFDINEVISYFNTEGNVVFSNESDKYYKYQILDQIDYEKLIRFKTATIKMHVQPFKYPTDEEQIQVDATVVTGEGSNISLQYTNPNTVITSEIEGDTQQDGTPTPSSPIAVQTVTGNQNITVCGKNFYNKDIFIQGTWQSSSPANRIVGFLVPTKAGQKYTVSLRNNELDFAIGNTTKNVQSGNTQVQSDSGWQTGTYTYTITGDGYLFLQIKKRYGGSFTPSILSANDFQVELGETATDYQPYQSQSYTINLGSTELCKIGNYQDKIYKDEGMWYLEKQINKITLDNTKTWAYYSVAEGSLFRSNNSLIDAIIDYDYVPYSNYYKGISMRMGRTNYTIKPNVASGYSYLDILDNRYTNVDDFKTFIGNNSVTFYYVLVTPTATEITDTDLIAQLNALAGATTYDNQTNIIVSGSLPANLSVSTQGMPNTVINNIGNIYAKPLITIYGSGNIGVYLNQIQVLQIALGDAGSITIDVAKMEAYNQSTQVLMNRLVTGDYMNFLINSGQNNLAFSGNVLGFTMDNYTRWI